MGHTDVCTILYSPANRDDSEKRWNYFISELHTLEERSDTNDNLNSITTTSHGDQYIRIDINIGVLLTKTH